MSNDNLGPTFMMPLQTAEGITLFEYTDGAFTEQGTYESMQAAFPDLTRIPENNYVHALVSGDFEQQVEQQDVSIAHIIEAAGKINITDPGSVLVVGYVHSPKYDGFQHIGALPNDELLSSMYHDSFMNEPLGLRGMGFAVYANVTEEQLEIITTRYAKTMVNSPSY